jgi:hypothetical protein
LAKNFTIYFFHHLGIDCDEANCLKRNKPCILLDVKHDYESDLVITQIPIYAFICGSITLLKIYLLSVKVGEVL